MKNKFLRVFAFALAVISAISMASCGKKTIDNGKTVKVEAVLENGDFAYSIIRSKDASDAIEDASKELRSAIRKNFDTSVKLNKDTLDYSADNREILIGSTNRPESEAGAKEVADNRVNNAYDFIVKVTGNKIVINAVNEEAVITAVKWFTETFCKSKATWAMLNSEYKFLYQKELDTTAHTIAGEHIKDYKIVVPRQTSLIVRNAVTNFQELFAKKSGFKLDVIKDDTAETDKEILIGDTNREASKSLPVAGTYRISVSDKKLVLTGNDYPAITKAVNKLCEIYEKASEAKEPMTFAPDYSLTEKSDASQNDFKMVYNDEFKTLDRSMWVRYGSPTVSQSPLGTNTYGVKDEGVFVKDGNLVIQARHEKDDTFTHRQISNVGTHFWQYGVYEIRAKLGVYPGVAAFWTGSYKPKDVESKGIATVELDILEGFGKGNGFASNIHLWWANGGHSSLDGTAFAKAKKFTLAKEGAMMSDEYHIFSYEWNTDVMNFAVDGEVYFSFDLNTDTLGTGMDSYKYLPSDGIILSNTMGASTYGEKWRRGDPDLSEVLVDYVRLYQRDSDGGFSRVQPK